MNKKRLFFALHLEAPWPDPLPDGRLLVPEERHMTLVFLGETDFDALMEKIPEMPKPSFKLGPSGFFDKSIFLRHVVAWHGDLGPKYPAIVEYQKTLADWLHVDEHRQWLPHATIARSPFNHKEWREIFQPIPFTSSRIHLYESLGHSRYEPRWTHEFIPPFEEISHTADIAYLVRGENMRELLHNAQMALAFRSHTLLQFKETIEPQSIEDIVKHLNDAIAKVDAEYGCPLKSVSFHGNISTKEFIEWEMIVDV